MCIRDRGTGGHQSASVAFLDANRTGTVVTAIQGRDYARVYVKELERGRPSLALSPEEAEAVERAMARYASGTMFPPTSHLLHRCARVPLCRLPAVSVCITTGVKRRRGPLLHSPRCSMSSC